MKDVIEKRRAYRSLEKFEVRKNIINDLMECARLAPSCFNKQPWRFVFVYDENVLKKLHDALSPGNEWAKRASMIVAVCSKKEYDCIIKDREYYLFDTGMAVAFLILRATEMGMVAHPIAGYSQKKVKEILGIPEDIKVITLIIFGIHSDKIDPSLSQKQREAEENRPERKKIGEICFHNAYKVE